MIGRHGFVVMFIASLLLITTACSFTAEQLKDVDGYRFVCEDKEKTWWFKMDSVEVFSESSNDLLLQAQVRIDYKLLGMTEIAYWYFRNDIAEYKSTDTFTYNEDGCLLEE